jgi:hypothetical protein
MSGSFGFTAFGEQGYYTILLHILCYTPHDPFFQAKPANSPQQAAARQS